jgi:hypothetical protein
MNTYHNHGIDLEKVKNHWSVYTQNISIIFGKMDKNIYLDDDWLLWLIDFDKCIDVLFFCSSAQLKYAQDFYGWTSSFLWENQWNKFSVWETSAFH